PSADLGRGRVQRTRTCERRRRRGGRVRDDPARQREDFHLRRGAQDFYTSLFKPHPREPMKAARLTSSRLSAEFPARAVRVMLSLESNSQPREPMAATTSITSGTNRFPGYF